MGSTIEPLYRYIRMGKWLRNSNGNRFLKLIFVTKKGFNKNIVQNLIYNLMANQIYPTLKINLKTF